MTDNTTERRESRVEATGYSSDPQFPTSTTVPGGAHKPLGVKVAEFLGMDTEDSYRAVGGQGPSTAQPLPTEGAMGTGEVRKSVDATTMEAPNGRRVSISGPTAGEEVGSSTATEHQYANDTTGASNFANVHGATTTSNV